MATLLTKRSNTAASVPLAAQLTNSTGGAELAVNTADKRLFTKDGSGNVVELGTAPTSLAVTNSVTVGGSLVASAGAAGTPSITASGDSNTGLFFPAADTVAVATGGTERVRVDGTGLGVGASPSYPLHVQRSSYGVTGYFYTNDGTGNPRLVISGSSSGTTIQNTWSSGASNLIFANGGSIGSGTEVARFDVNGNFGIGTSSPASKFAVVNSGAGFEVNPDGTGGGPALIAYNRSTSAYLQMTGNALLHTWQTSGTERMRIDSAGNVGIGTSSPLTKFTVSGGYITQTDGTIRTYLGADGSGGSLLGTQTNHYLRFTTNDTERVRISPAGDMLVGDNATAYNGKVEVRFAGGSSSSRGIITRSNSTAGTASMSFTNPNGIVGEILTSGTTTTYSTSSDYRLKHDIAPMTGALAKVAALKPVTYKWKVDGSDGQGFIAHELQEVVPDCVTGEKDAVDADGNPVYQGIDTSFLVATLTAAIQELKADLDATKAELAALKGQA